MTGTRRPSNGPFNSRGGAKITPADVRVLRDWHREAFADVPLTVAAREMRRASKGLFGLTEHGFISVLSGDTWAWV